MLPLSLKVTWYLHGIRENSPLLEEESRVWLSWDYHPHASRGSTLLCKGLWARIQIPGISLTLSWQRPHPREPLCSPFPRMRISVQYSSRDILALRLRDSLRGSRYHPFSHYPYNPEGVKDFNLMFSEGKLPYRDSKCVASNHKANRALDSRSVFQNGSGICSICTYLECKC